MCGTALPEPNHETVFGVTIFPEEDEPYLIYRSWFDDKPRTVSREQHNMNLVLAAAALALNFLVWIPIAGLLWATAIVSAAVLVAFPLAHVNFKKARKRAENAKGKRGR